jgi:hypothetical protein
MESRCEDEQGTRLNLRGFGRRLPIKVFRSRRIFFPFDITTKPETACTLQATVDGS